MNLERLQAGEWRADIAPAIGGSLAAFYSAATDATPRRDWLRPASAEALRDAAPQGMASFPLLPWCNRIRDGRFEWQGREIVLQPQTGVPSHALHGIGWRRPWHVAGRGAAWIELVLDEPASGAWPFAFRATQRYALEDGGLTIAVAVRNTGLQPMPAGIGHHPYFAHRRDGAGTRLRAVVDAIWLADAEILPTALSSADPAVAALRAGMPLAHFDLDNNFTGFAHAARVDWPDGSGLRLLAEPPLDFFVLYCPSKENLFVMEAVSNCADWINLRRHHGAAETGGATLEPGATLQATTRLVPEPTPTQRALHL